jgi:hypothetical protein
MIGITGYILAAALTQQPTTCTVVNLSPLSVVCNAEPAQVEIRDFTWPNDVWGQTHLTGRYNAEIVNSEVFPLPTGPVVDNEALREQTLQEMRRWRIPPTQSITKN